MRRMNQQPGADSYATLFETIGKVPDPPRIVNKASIVMREVIDDADTNRS
jgi:hypothetical protein